MREIIVAKSAGFCWGVQRAFDKVLKIADEVPECHGVKTYGPLFHNPQAVEMLESKGISVLNDIPDHVNGTVIIRTHGVSPEERKKLKTAGADVKDATCPDVGRIQGLVRKHKRLGYKIIIVGEKHHPEVKALLGFACDDSRCIISKEDVLELPNWEKVCVVSQSTQPHSRFWALVDEVKKRFPSALVFDTICKSTEQRQDEAKRLAKKVSAMIVVGGRNSANTNRLAEICRESGTPTYFIETAEELDPNELKDVKTIGITAGASTPSWIIEDVVSFLKGLPNGA